MADKIFIKILYIFFIILILLSYILDQQNIALNIIYNTTILTISVSLCIIAIRSLPRRGFNFGDPALIFIIYSGLNILPIAIIALFSFDTILFKYPKVCNVFIYSKTLFAHSIFITSFTTSYIFLSSKYRNCFDSRLSKLTLSLFWVYFLMPILFLFLFFNFYTGLNKALPWRDGSQVVPLAISKLGLLGGQIYNKFQIIASICLVFGFGVLLSRAKSLINARRRLFIISFILFVSYYSLSTSRSFILVYAIGSIAYADVVRWKGELMNWKLVSLCVFCGFVLNITTKIIEAYIISNYDLISKLQVTDILTLGTAPINIISTIIRWIDNSIIPLSYFQNYINAIKGVIPGQAFGGPVQSLSSWFAYEVSPIYAQSGAAFGFSIIAEGYLNAKMLGVFFQGIILGMFAGIIRFFQVSKRLKHYGVFFYAALLSSFFKFYHLAFNSVISKYQWYIICTIILLLIMKIHLRTFSFRKKIHAKI